MGHSKCPMSHALAFGVFEKEATLDSAASPRRRLTSRKSARQRPCCDREPVSGCQASARSGLPASRGAGAPRRFRMQCPVLMGTTTAKSKLSATATTHIKVRVLCFCMLTRLVPMSALDSSAAAAAHSTANAEDFWPRSDKAHLPSLHISDTSLLCNKLLLNVRYFMQERHGCLQILEHQCPCLTKGAENEAQMSWINKS